MEKSIETANESVEVIIRSPYTVEDLRASENVEREVWGFLPGDDMNIVPIFSQFAKGFLVAYVNGEAAGQMYSIRLNYDLENPVPTWNEVSAYGKGDTHEPDGETLYVIALGVSPRYRGMRIGGKLVQSMLDRCVELNCKRVVLGCRIPDYHKHSDIPVEEYIKMKDEFGKYIDRELRFYSRCGLYFTKPLPEYMSDDAADPESLNYGVLSIWDNPYYK